MPEKPNRGGRPEKPVSLAPLEFEEALAALMETGEHSPEEPEEIEDARQRAREDADADGERDR